MNLDRIYLNWKKGDAKECIFISYEEACILDKEYGERESVLWPYFEMDIWDKDTSNSPEYFKVTKEDGGSLKDRFSVVSRSLMNWYVEPDWIKTIKGVNDTTDTDIIFNNLLGQL